MKSVIFVVCAMVGACGGMSGDDAADQHSHVPCGSAWMDNLPTCELACEDPVATTGVSCSDASSGSAVGRCDATFVVDGQRGCCQATSFGPSVKDGVRVFLVCAP